jgi:ABC-type dipeptide/oligopeptide/nickel transport system permease component
MLAYMVRRLLWTPVLLLVVSLIVFFLGTYGPGDPIEVRMGQNYDPVIAERLREQLGLNDPFPVQWGRYVVNVVQGDLGESFQYQGRKVTAIIGPKLLVSAQLNIWAFIVVFGFGVPLGFMAAKRQGTWRDPGIVISSLALYALPVFIIAPTLIQLFAVNLDWLPASGWGGFLDRRAILPVVTVGVPGIAVFVRLMRASTLDVLGQEFVRTARSKGLSEFVVNYRHIARNAMIPIMTVLGFSFAGMLGGALITELMFGIPGIARTTLDAVFARDYPILIAVVLLGATMLVLANLLVDFLYTVVDPRIRLR